MSDRGGRGVPDWRDGLLQGITWADATPPGRDPVGWPGYRPRTALRWGRGSGGGREAVVCSWDFTTYGGSFGEAEAAAFTAAAGAAATERRPLVTLVRSGGTRLQEGMAALVGIPRAALALDELAAAGVAHVSLVDSPTTGGIWVTVAGHADLRVGVAGAVVGFSGPRVVQAMTGAAPPAGSHTAEAAAAAGLVDTVVPPDPAAAAAALGRALAALAADSTYGAVAAPPVAPPPDRSGREQLHHCRAAARPDGAELLGDLLAGAVPLRGGDATVAAAAGRLPGGRPAVGVALAAARAGAPTVAGYALLTRAAELADRLGLALVTLVDTPGADPSPASEAAGIAPAIARALGAVLGCRAPTVAVVHGEGGSGGALAAAVTDTVLVTPAGWFAPLAPDGAAVALRRDRDEVADAMAITPRDLLALGFADRPAPPAGPPLAATVAAEAARLDDLPAAERLARRRRRWSSPLPGRLSR